MLSSFRMRMLLVIVIVTIASFSMHSTEGSQVMEPIIKYVLNDNGLGEQIANWETNLAGSRDHEPVPVVAQLNLQVPCSFISIEKPYGWNLNKDKKTQEFSPQVVLKVNENTLVKPVLSGQVTEITNNANGRMVTIKHSDELISIYGGLNEALVANGAQVKNDQVLGKTRNHFYFELKNQDGPLNSQYLFD